MNYKNIARLRRARRTRIKIKTLDRVRLSVHRSSQHIYAQIISDSLKKVLVSASSIEKNIKHNKLNNIEVATLVGKLIAETAKKAGIDTVVFDRGGFLYHGRVKALADSAREAGLKF